MASPSDTPNRRCILVILDGLGDHGHAVFDGQTPLQAASTPNLDRLAALGMNGLYHSYLQGVAMPSEIAHFLMFGYDLADFPGRGYLEAEGKIFPCPLVMWPCWDASSASGNNSSI